MLLPAKQTPDKLRACMLVTILKAGSCPHHCSFIIEVDGGYYPDLVPYRDVRPVAHTYTMVLT
jgi:hypothetical protein